MTKEDLVTSISILLNQPTFDETKADYFSKKKHDDSVEELRQYLIKNKHFIGNPTLEVLQGLNDHGVDLILTTHNNIKIGFQIKSHNDVSQVDFAQKVKTQIAESAFHGVHKLYILICSPYNFGKDKYKAKITHLLSELSSYKTNFHCAYSPTSCIGLFLNNEPMDEDQFNSVHKQYTIETLNKEQIIEEIAPKELKVSFLNRLKEQKSTDFTTCKSFIDYVDDQGFQLNKVKLIEEITEYCKELKRVTTTSREFFVSVLKFAESYGNLGNCSNCIRSPYIDVQDSLGLGKADMLTRIKNLERFKLLNFDESDPYEDGQIVIGINGSNIEDDFNLSFEIREFLQNDLNKLKAFFIDLNFNLLD